MNIKDLDNLPKFTYHPTNTSLIDRLKAEKCELCGAVDKLVMHHVRKLKIFKGKLPAKNNDGSQTKDYCHMW